MITAYEGWKNDPATATAFTEVDINSMGYRLMGNSQLPAAIQLFELNAESYPQSFNVFDSLAEAYMNNNQNDLAIQFYEKSVEINPANQNGLNMLARLKGN